MGKSLLKIGGFGTAMVLVTPDQVGTWRFWFAVATAGGVAFVKGVAASGVGNRDSASLTRDV